MKERKLTTKQRRFIEFYDGNATDAARKAGYKGSDHTLSAIGNQNLRKPYIAAVLAAREKEKTTKHIATREERQAFWTKVANDPEEDMKNRLRASELLGKSQADFIEKRKVETTISFDQILSEIDGRTASIPKVKK